MAAVKEGTLVTIMICNKGFVENAHSLGLDFVDHDAWNHHGMIRLKVEWVHSVAMGMAVPLNGTVYRVWFDNNAGGYFADIDVSEVTDQMAMNMLRLNPGFRVIRGPAASHEIRNEVRDVTIQKEF